MHKLCVVCAILAIGIPHVLAVEGPPGADEMYAFLEPVQECFKQISFLNLINGLYLSTDQVRQIARICQDADAARRRWEPQIERERNKLLEAYAVLRADLVTHGLPVEGVSPAQHRAHQAKEEFERFLRAYGKARVGYESKISSVLNENQKQLIEEFRPCLIPPHREGEARVGQAAAGGGPLLRFLEISRRVPALELEEFKQRGLERHIMGFEEKFGKVEPQEKERFRQAVDRAVGKARSMSEADFEIAKEGLAEELFVKAPPGPEPPKPMMRDRDDRVGRIGRQFLDPELVPVLVAYEKARLAREAP